MPKITFIQEDGKELIFFASSGDTVLEASRKANVPIDAPCSGNASCGKCKVRLIKGELESAVTRHISELEYADGYRLACVSKIHEDVEVLVPDISSAYKSRMKITDLSSENELAIFEETRQNIKAAGLDLKNDWHVITCFMDIPTLDDTMPDNERLIRAVKKVTGFPDIHIMIPFSVIRILPDILRNNEFTVKCVLQKKKDCVILYGIYPEHINPVIAGIAVDIGTTSVSALLVNLENGEILAKSSAGNAQIRYGADVINRIVESCKPGGIQNLQKAIVDETINQMIDEMASFAQISRNDIVKMCIASNTTMNHLFLGINADHIRREPYIPCFFELRNIKASDVNVHIHPNADIIFAPNVGSYVGGDITAGALSSMIWNKEELSLFIDLGTNGEIVFGNKDFLMTCACSAGPAFEGGDISCGMRATDGAIEAVKINEVTGESVLSVIGEMKTKPVGICGSGIIDLVSELYRCKIIDSKGIFIDGNNRVTRDAFGMGTYMLVKPEDSGTIKGVFINEVDIDNFIRAKGAIFSAIKTLTESLDMKMSMIESVYVAGGIGSGINIKNSMNIGLFPKLPADCYHYIGNSSLSGAYASVLSDKVFKKVVEIGRNMTYIELSSNPGYMDEFMAACFIPHTDINLFEEK
ncbi:corrinoid activation/regeneration protein AcsV [Parasporobacterium paucivorans]|uniref:Uncharacterized 2Fe-2 and 4Fe-4S clusters-containing protein, contains DUF4445 domain n=1 Tax=Parasporobacterium paucivorans DSM 15970 TaxID=1122934 RepID=A0A1M6A8U2_9FIRM|nr:corrinoid activation/regeneration protein AcsV [Parasporobacterium paucivorans]SHI32871.1 Uncharacterized 2Fe-2 and 4Fe-4S clusters-containing protein, contains DUF4445 domain [Parasporobacterium paucivorans DSM 15970]